MGCILICPCRRKSRELPEMRRKSLWKEEQRIREDCLRRCVYTSDEDNDMSDQTVETFRANALRRRISVDPVDHHAARVVIEDYQFPFENLIFEGGAIKGVAYVGSIRCLEELGIMKQIKRVGGASAGAMTAAFLALGYNSEDIHTFLTDKNMEKMKIFLDHSCGYLSLLPNLLCRFGWNPGRRLYAWFGEKIRSKSKKRNPNMTFYELFKERKMELCVVVTNVNQMRTEYCHPKTTPDMPIREALCMTMAIPGLFMARFYDNHGEMDTYVDGGVLCNFPIHCFDGWYLSMERKDAFLRHLQSLDELPRQWSANNKFSGRNLKTVGFVLYDDSEAEVMRYSLEKRIGATFPARPSKNTKIYMQKQREKAVQTKFEYERGRVIKAVEAFMKVLHDENMEDREVIYKEDLRRAVKRGEETGNFSAEQHELLFGESVDVETAFGIMDRDGNGQIDFMELIHFIEERGIRIQTRIQGYGRREIKSFVQFLGAMKSAWTTNLKYVYIQDCDLTRIVGINTGHVSTSNFFLEKEDIDFLIKRGYNATRTFLAYYVAHHKVKKWFGSNVDLTSASDTTNSTSGSFEVGPKPKQRHPSDENQATGPPSKTAPPLFRNGIDVSKINLRAD